MLPNRDAQKTIAALFLRAMRQALQKPGGKAWAWAVLALVWAVALIVAAVFVPVYSTEGTAAPGGQTVTLHAQTFVHVNGVLEP